MIAHSAVCIGEGERAAVDRVLRSGRLAQGPEVEAFEAECAAFLGRRHAVAVGSGTAALHLALLAMGTKPGDGVAIPSYACAALATAVRLANVRPIVCDIGADYGIDGAAIPHDARAVIATHLFGAPAALPRHPNTIEDIAQIFGGAAGRGTPVAVASFYATKLMTTGEGGMAFTDDDGIADFLRDRRDYDNRDDGTQRFAYKMTEMQAAMGRVQLTRLPGFIARRRAIAARYDEAFSALPFALPAGADHIYFRYVVQTDRRDALQDHLDAAGIEAKRPVYAPAHHTLGGACPRAEAAHRTALSLPVHPALDEDAVGRVIDSVQAFFT